MRLGVVFERIRERNLSNVCSVKSLLLRSSGLKDHLLTHTGEKLSKCLQCQKLLNECLADRVSHRPVCHVGPAVTQSALPRRSCCLAEHSASPSACRAGRVVTPVSLPRSPRCRADPAASPTTVPRRPRVAPAVLPPCHAVRAAAPTLLPCRQQCLAGLDQEHTQESNNVQ